MIKLDGIDLEGAIRRRYPNATFTIDEKKVKLENWVDTVPEPTIKEVIDFEKAEKPGRKNRILKKLGLDEDQLRELKEMLDDIT